ncbi:MAG: CbtB domain-containing protein [Chromatiales bacterium]
MSNISQAHAYAMTHTPAFAALGAAVVGIVILFAVAFAPTPAVHNAAHDTRHALAFPCH